MDTFTKSFPVLSQMSEGEDGGRRREKMKWVEKRRGLRGTSGETKARRHRRMTSVYEAMRRHHTVCVVLTPLNGKNLDDAQRPSRAKLWESLAGDEFLMRREDSGAAPTLRER